MKKTITCIDYKKNKIEVETKKLKFRPSVYGVLIENGKILLSKQWDGYDFPGGGINIDETIEEALRREFFEETGIKIKVLGPVHCETSFFHPVHSKIVKNQFWNCVLIYFLVKKVGGKISIENFDSEEKKYADMPEWIPLNKLNKLKFYNQIRVKELIKKALKSK
jgi:8-oxo-dGTP diphosphatase